MNPKGVDPLTLYSGMKEGFINEKLSFSAAGQVRAAEGNPYNVYKKLMGLATGRHRGTPGTVDQLILRRNSVNDLDPRRAERPQGQVRPLERGRQGAPRPALQRHPRHGEHHDDDGRMQCSPAGWTSTAINAMNTGSAFKQNGKIEDVAKLQVDLVGSRSRAT